MDDRLRQAPCGVIETTIDGIVRDVDETAPAAILVDSETLRGSDIREAFPRSASGTLRAAFGGDSVTPDSFEEYYPEIDRWLAVDVSVEEGTFDGDGGESDGDGGRSDGEEKPSNGEGRVLVYVRDRTDQREAERRVERLERRFDRVEEIDTLVATVLRRVLDASDRREVAETVCERLGGTDLYRFAWVGDRAFPADRLRVLATSGAATDLPDEIERVLDGEAALDGETTLPEQRAIETAETQLVETIADDEAIPHGVRRAAFGQGLQSCLAVPLAYQGTVYGVLSVYSGQEGGFSDQERAGLETLGNVAGFAVRAIRQEDLLVADTVTEVTLAVRDGTVPFVRAARETDAHLSLHGAVPRGDGTVVCYLGVAAPEGGSSDSEATDETAIATLDQLLTDADGVADVRWIRRGQDPLGQVTVTADTPVTALVGWGATVRTAEYTAGSARFVAEVPPDGDVRRLVEAVDATVAETDLLAREETTRSPEPVAAFRDGLDERLTDRQRTVLRTAYLSDYFASPRGSTSAEVAETLDIAGSTMLHHLRRAERKLVDAFFEPDP